MTTANDLVEQTLGHLLTGASEELNQLGADVNTSVTTISFTRPLGGIAPGAYLSIGLEDLYVWDTPSTSSATVMRGARGTTAAAHTTGDVVKVKPRFPPARILGALNAELADLSSPSVGLFRILGVDITFNAAVQGYDLAGITNLVEVYELRYKANGTAKSWPLIERRFWRTSPGMAASEFASTNALFITDGGTTGQPVRLRYKASFAPLATLIDDVANVTGLHVEAHDIPPLGAAIRLAAGREIRRNFDESEGSSRRAEEVPAGANLNATAGLRNDRRDRIRHEAVRLANRYPEARV